MPAVFVASLEFVTAAESQAASLGLPDAARVFVPHPIQEMRDYADTAFDEIVARLVSG